MRSVLTMLEGILLVNMVSSSRKAAFSVSEKSVGGCCKRMRVLKSWIKPFEKRISVRLLKIFLPKVTVSNSCNGNNDKTYSELLSSVLPVRAVTSFKARNLPHDLYSYPDCSMSIRVDNTAIQARTERRCLTAQLDVDAEQHFIG